MKNLMLYVVEEGSHQDMDAVRRNLDLQVENSLDLGWAAEDVLLYANFAYESRGVAAIEIDPPARPPTARATSFFKTRVILRALKDLGDDEVFWYHDVDAYQLGPLPAEPSPRPLAFCLYQARDRLLIQGGSLFIRRSARPIFEYVDHRLHEGCRKDEFALTEATSRPELLDAFCVLDYAFNLGTTDFELRYQLAHKPILVAHFHLGRGDHRALLLGRRNPLGVRVLDDRFVALVEKHGFGSPPPAGRRVRRTRPLRTAVDAVRRVIAQFLAP